MSSPPPATLTGVAWCQGGDIRARLRWGDRASLPAAGPEGQGHSEILSLCPQAPGIASWEGTRTPASGLGRGAALISLRAAPFPGRRALRCVPESQGRQDTHGRHGADVGWGALPAFCRAVPRPCRHPSRRACLPGLGRAHWGCSAPPPTETPVLALTTEPGGGRALRGLTSSAS